MSIPQGAHFNITVFQGGSYARTMSWREADGVTRKSLAGYTGKAEIRDRPGGATLFAEFVVDVSQVVDTADEDCGIVELTLDADDTAAIERSGSWDLALSNDAGDVVYVIQGRVILDRRVTVIEEDAP